MKRLCLIGYALVLALSLLLQGQSAAARVTMTDATGQIVICTGTGPMTIYVDAEGQPADPPSPCPECLILSVAAVLPDTAAPVAPLGFGRAVGLHGDDLQSERSVRAPSARAPPLFASSQPV